jgi:pre-mRNA cleavage complex 2 protein Pcf11
LEKSMTRTQERDWYIDSVVWMGETTSQQGHDNESGGANETSAGNAGGATDDGYDPATSTMPADESRDRCIICGLNLKMEFDNDDGMYKYQNCREIEVLNDEEVVVNQSELRLVHVTCWRGLGSPVVLTMDQALQETLHY